MSNAIATRQVSILCQYRVRGLHVHCRFFSGFVGGTRGNAGELVMRVEEFTAYKMTLEEIGRGLIPDSAPAIFEFRNVDPGAEPDDR